METQIVYCDETGDDGLNTSSSTEFILTSIYMPTSSWQDNYNRIKELREQRGLTQEQLGELVGASRQAINAIETEKFEPSIWLAYDISKVFECAIEDVFLFDVL